MRAEEKQTGLSFWRESVTMEKSAAVRGGDVMQREYSNHVTASVNPTIETGEGLLNVDFSTQGNDVYLKLSDTSSVDEITLVYFKASLKERLYFAYSFLGLAHKKSRED